MVPYAVRNQNWVSYDDPASITKKVEFALDKNLAGVMVWSIETDDFHGSCHGEDFPLLRAINKALGSTETSPDVSSSSSTTSTTTTMISSTMSPTTSASTTSAPATEGKL